MRSIGVIFALFLSLAVAGPASAVRRAPAVRASSAQGHASEHRGGFGGCVRAQTSAAPAAAGTDSFLFGKRAVYRTVDRLRSGVAEGFAVRSRATGTVSSIRVYVDRHSHADKIRVALYSDPSCRVGVLLTTGLRLRPTPGRWNRVSVRPTSVRSGKAYWVAVLGAGGTLDARRGTTKRCVREFVRQSVRGSWRRMWRARSGPRACAISAYAAGALTANGTLGGGGSGSGSAPPGTGTGSGPEGFVAANVYVSENASGTGNGSSCANAQPYTWFNNPANWGSGTGQLGPGKIVGFCGTISSPLTVQGSGSSSSPITVFWEPGATMSAPDWTGGGAVNTNGNSYITLNGGDNGTSIQATADGSGMADQGVASKGISASRCTGCTFENLTIANLYVHTSTSDSSVDQTSDNAIKWSGSNVTVADNTVHDVGWALWFSGSTGDTNEEIYGNDVYNIDHGIIIAPPATSIGNVFIFGNHIHDLANWDCGGACHHDPIHCFGSENGVLYSGFYIYDNLFDGSWGSATSSATFIEGNFGSSGDTPCAASGSSVWIFNNVSKPSDQMGCCGQIGNAAGGTGGMFNNMARGPSNTQNVGECMGYSASSNGSTAFFENNIMDNCDVLINGNGSGSGSTTGTYASGTPDYDAYVNGGANAFSTRGPSGNCTSMSFSKFTLWKSCMGGVESHGNAFATETAAGINTDGSLNSGSPLIGTANNLTSTCNTFPTTPANVRAACETTYTGPPTGGGSGSTTAPTPRPTSGAWNIGPY